MKLLFRVDIDKITGTGHLTRCITLANALKPHNIKFLIKGNTGKELLKSHLFKAYYIPENTTREDESKYIVNVIKKFKPDVTVIDLLDIPHEYPRQFNGKKTICLQDDFNFIMMDCINIFNHNICQGGQKYFILDDAFKGKQVQVRQKVKTVFINSGGSDPYNLTPRILKAIKPFKGKVIVVMGAATDKQVLDETKAMSKAFKDITIHHNISHKKIVELMLESDIAITAAGNTLYELCSIGMPCIVISHHEKHDRVAKAFGHAVIDLGIGDKISGAKLNRAFFALCRNYNQRKSLSRFASCLIDGKGTDRIKEAILCLK